MKRLLVAVLAGLVLAAPVAGFSAADEIQKQMILRAKEAKRKQAAAEVDRQRSIAAPAQLTGDTKAQPGAARPPEGASPQQVRE